jgi:hypothetical protein
MREIYGNIWEIECDAICITTNGVVKRDGTAVMGAGIARQAREKFPKLDVLLGAMLKLNGNKVNLMLDKVENRPALIGFPTKNDWRENSSLQLIERSSRELVELVNSKGWKYILLPRPGCGNGNLDWREVRRVIGPILDERFFIITFRTMNR